MQPNLTPFIERGIAVKIETTEGVDAGPDVSVDGALLFDGLFATQYDKKERNPDRTFFGSPTYSIGNKQMYIEGDFELFCPPTPGQSTTALPFCHPMLLIAGMAAVKNSGAKTTTYSPVSTGIPSATLYFWQSDQFVSVLGARNDIKSLKMEIGSIFTGKTHMLGNYEFIVDQDMPSVITYDTIPVTMAYNISDCYVSVDNGAMWLEVWAKSLEVVFNSKLASKEYTSIKRNAISGRAATFNLLIAKTENGSDGLGDFNALKHRDDATIVLVKMRTYESGVAGELSGLYSELAVRGQMDTVAPTNTDDDFTWQIGGSCVPSSAGGDEFTLTFGDNTFAITGSYAGGSAGAVAFTPGTSGTPTLPLAWTATGLPSPLVISPTTGEITGTAVAGGPTTVHVTATDSNPDIPQVATKTYTLTYV